MIKKQKETLIHSANEMKHEAHGTQQPRHINAIGEGASAAQRSDLLVQSINQCFQKNFLAGALFLSASILFSASVFATQQVEIPSPDCAFTTLEGSPVKGLRSMQGEVVYVDFWASWCPPCVKSFPFLNQMEHEFKAQGLHVIGVNLDEKKADAQAFLDKNPVDFEIVADQTKQCAKDFGVIAMPSSFLIDRKGNVRYVHQGFRPGESDQLRMMVEQVLAEKH